MNDGLCLAASLVLVAGLACWAAVLSPAHPKDKPMGLFEFVVELAHVLIGGVIGLGVVLIVGASMLFLLMGYTLADLVDKWR